MATRFTPGSAVEPTSTVEISISCRKLPDTDTLSRSDPMCVVYHQSMGTSRWTEILRTEVIWDTLDPDFATKVTMDYTFEQDQLLRFEVFDIDSVSTDLESHDFLGFAECKMAELVSAGYNSLKLPLMSSKHGTYVSRPAPAQARNYKGTLILLAEELMELKEEVTLKLEGRLMGSSLFCMFAPKIFYVLSKTNEAGSYTVVQRSDPVRGENASWKSVPISMRSLCNGDRDRGLQIQFFQVGMNGYHTLLGTVNTSANQMMSLVGGDALKLSKDGKEKSSSVRVSIFRISPVYTFMEYISTGTQIHCCFAIDFTASNGDPMTPNTLHHISTTGRTNPYEQAIQAVGDIIQDYDATKQFPVYGFGARIPPNGETSHHFPITLAGSPYCSGIAEVLGNYRKCIRQVQLYGPTNFAPIIRDVAHLARQNMNGQHYYVLLIITDGIITDMEFTKEAIVNAATLPLSILIVGVGGADFTAMEELDGDTVRLSSHGVMAARDIVQFVPYRDAYSWTASISPATTGGNYAANFDMTSRLAKAKLAQEVLAEIPSQLTSFMKSCNIVPVRRPS